MLRKESDFEAFERVMVEVGTDRSSGRPPTESEAIGDRGHKLIARIPSSGQIDRQTNRGPVPEPSPLPIMEYGDHFQRTPRRLSEGTALRDIG
jgi:hypothetical protein